MSSMTGQTRRWKGGRRLVSPLPYPTHTDYGQRGNDKPDLMQYLLTNTKPDARGTRLLFAESRVIIGAGRLVLSLV